MDERVRRTVETYERVADTYANIHGDREVVADLVERFVAAVGDASGLGAPAARPRVLDVGCGPGWESAAFDEHGFDPVSFDLTGRFLEQARERVPDAAAVRGDMRALPFADASFDGLWACASLLHVPESEVPATLADFERVLTDGGVVLVSLKRSTSGDDGLRGSPYDDDERHFERYEPETVTRLFEDAGFAVRSVDTSDDSDTHDDWVAVCAVA
ncbi:class I SAM-dependent methyltransferase [Halosimplex salinum]|uniref:class I SAM-dependent methyltransferase n=1 Tax=Halosimplex salinum TaxID=1710538 RepID=UPI000F4A21B8|nr:class I SAM-dependent methyltransferase [Halosimplex salinum]